MYAQKRSRGSHPLIVQSRPCLVGLTMIALFSSLPAHAEIPDSPPPASPSIGEAAPVSENERPAVGEGEAASTDQAVRPTAEREGESRASPETEGPPRFFIGFGLGLESCFPDGEADCAGLYPGVAWDLSAAVRFLDYLGLSLSASQGWLFGSDDVYSERLSFTLAFTGWIPLAFEKSELFLSGGLGPGWLSAAQRGADEPFFEWSSLWANGQFIVGLQRDWWAGWRSQVSLTLSMHERGSYCLNYSGASRCAGQIEPLRPDERVSESFRLGFSLIKVW